MPSKKSKKQRIKIGSYVTDYAVGRNGIIIDGPWIENESETHEATGFGCAWEWLILYDGGELSGADTSDLQPGAENIQPAIDWMVSSQGEQL